MRAWNDSYGVALPLALLLLVALTLIGHGALYLAQRELEVAVASSRDLRITLAAESVVRSMERSWPTEEAIGLEPGGSVGGSQLALPRGVTAVGTIRRLSRELYLLEGIGGQEGWPGTVRTLRIVWVVDPDALLASADAVAQVGGEVAFAPQARIEGGRMEEPVEGWDAQCQTYQGDVESLYPEGVLASVARVGPEPGGLLGPLAAADLVSLGKRVSGVVSPSPEETFGTCLVADSLNWGAPLDPGGPCGDHLPLVVATGSLSVREGQGQGVLVVGGDLSLRAGFHFTGTVFVGGDLVLNGDARIDGLVKVLGRLELRDRARIVGSGCAGLRALRRAESLRAPVPLPVRSWISPY